MEESLAALAARIEKLERTVRLLAEREAAEEAVRAELLDLAGPKKPRRDNEVILTNGEAAAYVGMASSTFRAWKKQHGLKPCRLIGHRPQYRLRDIDDAVARSRRVKEV